MYTITIIITYTDQWEILFVDELDNARTEIETQAQSTANFKGMLRKLLWLSRILLSMKIQAPHAYFNRIATWGFLMIQGRAQFILASTMQIKS